jgi:hypothetical protein
VVLLPFVAVLVISIHYYKVSREHGISLPAKFEDGNATPEAKKEAKQRVDFIPDLLTHEVFLTALGLFAVILISIFFYSAPLEHIANPQVTPLDTKAPWYFWWLQGMLKIDPAAIIEGGLARIGLHVELSALLNSKQIMGIIFPSVLVGLLLSVPYIDRNPHRSMYKRPYAVAVGLLFVIVMLVLSYMGQPQYGIESPAATRILQDLAPEEGLGPLRAIPFAELKPGYYEVNKTPTEGLCPEMDFGCPELEAVFADFTERVNLAAEEGKLPDVEAVLVIEDWQADLKKVTPRIIWTDPESGERQTYERHIFLHSDRGGEH